MSQGRPVPAAFARDVAKRVVALLAPSCERIEIAGSLRRGQRQVRDIEIVAVPGFREVSTGDLWGSTELLDLLEDRLAYEIAAGETSGFLRARPVENHRADGSIDVQTKLGPAFKALLADSIPLDLFIVRPPASWGVIFALRTGPGDWNTRLVTDCKAISRRVREGQVEAWVGATGRWQPVPTPEEGDFFAALGQPWVEPAERTVERVEIHREIAAGAPA